MILKLFIKVARILLFFLFILNFKFSIFNSTAQTNIVYSCDFENWTGNKPVGWEITSPTSIVVVSPYTPAYSGEYSCKAENNKGNSFINMISTETFSIKPDKKYELTFTIKMLKGNSNVEIAFKNPDYFEVEYYLSKVVNVDFSYWKTYKVDFFTSGLVFNSLIMGNSLSLIMNGIGGPVEFIIDDITLVESENEEIDPFNYLDANNIKAYFNPITPFLYDGNLKYFEVPKYSGKSTIFTTNIWLGGMDEQNQLHVAAQKFCQQGIDFFLGPITNDYIYIYGEKVTSEEFNQKYHRTWKVTKEEIEYHKVHYADFGYEMPWGIANWPAHGRTDYGESSHLAPYKSISGKDFYTPSLGDYPAIRGDQAIFFIMNDDLEKHTESKGVPLGVEILGMVYAYSSTDSALNNTIFLSYVLCNKSTKNYKDFYFGFWCDYDIGFAKDDYVGCDTLLNLGFGYNGKEIDGNGEYYAYGTNPPAQGTILLNKKMSSFVYHNNNATLPTGDPNYANEYYNLLVAKWKNGVPITYGGNGYNSGSTNYTNFMFSGDPVTKTGWTEFTPNGPDSTPNPPDDRRGLMSAGPFLFPAGESLCFDIALPWARDYQENNPASVALLKTRAKTIQQFYDNQNYAQHCAIVTKIKEKTFSNNTILLYPNPTQGRFTITGAFIIEYVELFDAFGKKIFSDYPKKQSTQINTQLSKGFYFYRVLLENHTTCSGKIVVQP